MTTFVHLALAWWVIAAIGTDLTPVAAGQASPKPQAPAASSPGTPPRAAVVPAAQDSSASWETLDATLVALQARVQELVKAAETAEAEATDELARLRVRARLNTDLLLLVLQHQELLYQQQKALRAALTHRPGVAPGERPASTSAGYTGVVFTKRDRTGKAHRPGCAFGEKIAPADRITFPSLAEALAAGIGPCKVCRP